MCFTENKKKRAAQQQQQQKHNKADKSKVVRVAGSRQIPKIKY